MCITQQTNVRYHKKEETLLDYLNNFDELIVIIKTPVFQISSIIRDFNIVQTDSMGIINIATDDDRELNLPATGWISHLDSNMITYNSNDISISIEGINYGDD